MRKTTFNFFAILISSILLLGLLGCPGQQDQPSPQPGGEPTAQDQPTGQPVEEPIEQPVEQPVEEPVEQPVEGAVIPGGELGQVIVDFFSAMAEPDFARARTYCTQTFYDRELKIMEEMYNQLSEEDKARMKGDFTLDEEKQNQLASATTQITGNTATLTITEEDGTTSVLGYVNEAGVWKLDSIR